MRVVFAGTPAFSLSSLEALVRHPGVEVVGVYTQPDRPAGRGKKLTVSPVRQRALEFAINVYQPLSLKSEQAVEQLRGLAPDLMVVTAYGLILPPDVLTTPGLGCINVHASLLPRWRGAAPIQRAIQAGDAVSGVTLMQMDPGLDTGAMLAHSKVEIADDDTTATLHDKLAYAGGRLLSDSIDLLAAGQLTAIAQNNNDACYAEKLHKSEAAIDWKQSAINIDRQVRAFNPWPIAETWLGDTRLRVHQATVSEQGATMPAQDAGEILAIGSSGVEVACGSGVLCLTRVQKVGGRPMDIADFLNGSNLEPGMRFEQPQK